MRLDTEKQKAALSAADVIVSVDIETTGFSRKTGGEVLEIGAVMVDLKKRKIIKSFSSFCSLRLTKKIPGKITQLTGITDDMIKGAGKIEDVISDFHSFIGNYPLVFHNASFDWDRYLDPILKECGFIVDNHIIDTLSISKDLLCGLKEKNLESLCSYFGIKMKEQHRAKSDAIYTASVAGHLKEFMGSQLPMPDKVISKTLAPAISISAVNPWESAEKKPRRRVYVATNVGTVFYDYKFDFWHVKEGTQTIPCDIDLEEVKNKVFEKLNVSSISQMENKLFA